MDEPITCKNHSIFDFFLGSYTQALSDYLLPKPSLTPRIPGISALSLCSSRS